MARNQNYTVRYKRKRNGKTDYKSRLKIVKSLKNRIIIRKSNKHVVLQVGAYAQEGDKILLSAHTKELSKFGWKGGTGNISSAYLVGYLLGNKMKNKNLTQAIIDIGMQTSAKGGVIFSAVKGIVDSGVLVPCSKEVFPTEERIKGNHVANYAKEIKKNKEKYKILFSKYLKNGLDPEKIPEHFISVKKSIEVKK